MTDIGDILGLNKNRPNNGLVIQSKALPNKKTKQNKTGKKIPRLLYNLVGNQQHASSLVSTAPTLTFRRGNSNGVRGASSILRANEKLTWRWKPFSNSGRSDNKKAKLNHWKRSDAPKDIDYQFSKFNKEIIVVAPMENETGEIVANEEWSVEDTMKLISCCHKYELRWPIIHDRWDGEKTRTEEALKTRYYEVAKVILRYRFEPGRRLPTKDSAPLPSDDSIRIKQPKGSEATEIMDLDWSSQKEKERVQLAEQSFRLTEQDEKESKRLKGYVKRIDVELRKLKRDRTLMNKSKHKISSSSSSSNSNRTANANLKDHNISGGYNFRPPQNNLPQPTFGPGSDGSSVVYLRSSRLANVASSSETFGKKMVGKITKVLNELSVPSRPLPTQRVCDAYDKLRQDIIHLLTARKYYHNKNGNRGRKVPPPKVQEIEDDLMMGASTGGIYGSGMLAVPGSSPSTINKAGGSLPSLPTTTATATSNLKNLNAKPIKRTNVSSTTSNNNNNKNKSISTGNTTKKRKATITLKGPKKRSRTNATPKLKDFDDINEKFTFELPSTAAAAKKPVSRKATSTANKRKATSTKRRTK